MDKPLISVCMLCYNHEKFVAESILSIQNQTYDNWELIIVDNASTDRSKEIIESLIKDDARVIFLPQESNKYVSSGLNIAIQKSKGDYIAFISADDFFVADKLTKQVNYMIDKELDLSFTWVNVVDSSSKHNFQSEQQWFNIKEAKNAYDILREYFSMRNVTYAPTAMIKTSVFDEIRLHDHRLLQTQDLELWIRVLSQTQKVEILQEKLTNYRVLNDGENLSSINSHSKKNRNNFEMHFIWEQLYALDNGILSKVFDVEVNDVNKNQVLYKYISKHSIGIWQYAMLVNFFTELGDSCEVESSQYQFFLNEYASVGIEDSKVVEERDKKLQKLVKRKLYELIDKFKAIKPSKRVYLYIKSNRFLRKLYHNLPISNELGWKIRQFISTGKFGQNAHTNIVEDDLNFSCSTTPYESTTKTPLVSIVIPCYNQGCYLWESVSSAYASYSGKLEVIIVDDGSTDVKTKKCLREIKIFFPEVQIIHKENGGLSSARNRGIKYSSGDYVQLLDADDLLAPGKIDIQLACRKRNDDVLVSNYLTSNENCSKFYKTEDTIKGFDFTLDDFLYKWERGLSVPIHCGLFPSKVFDELRFDEGLSAKEDWFLWINILLRGYRLDYVDVHSVIYRIHTESMVRKSFVKMSKQWENVTKKIVDLLDISKQDRFLQESYAWLENYYRSNPSYKRELKEIAQEKTVETSKKQVIINQNSIDELIGALKDFGDESPIISIVIPIFNHYDYLFESIASLARQGNVPLELICIDDNSSDDRVHVLLKEVANASLNIKVILHQKNKGISFTQNEAVKIAKGRYIAFLDCDDYLKDNALSVVYKRVQEKPEVDYFFTDRANIDEYGEVLHNAYYKTVKSEKSIKDDLLDRMVASHLKVIKKETYISVGGSDEKMSGIQDWDLALKIAEVGELDYIEDVLYYHRLHENSVTSFDSVAQYKKTNILRRKFSKRWLKPTSNEENIDDIMAFVSRQDFEGLKKLDTVKIFDLKNLNLNSWYCPQELKDAYVDNKLCIIDARGMVDKVYIEFLKDFNSYVDFILCDRLSVSSQIIGTLWSEKILITPLLRDCR